MTQQGRPISNFTLDNTILGSNIIPYVDLSEPILANRSKIVNFSSLKSQIVNPDPLTVVIGGNVTNKTYSLILNSPYSFNITRVSSILSSGTCTVDVLEESIQVTNVLLNTLLSPSLNVETGDNLTITITNSVSAIDLTLTLVLERV